jgi:arylsulfatase A-like enzyme
LVAIGLASSAYAAPESESGARPNIVFVFADDLGYGEIQALNPERSKIPTPSADRLASQGMIFTDAHSGSSVCTPTRYGLMTGRYSWRTWLQRGVVKGFAPNLIAEGRPTVAGFLQEQGYHTAIIGKWHLNFQYLNPETGEAYQLEDYGKSGALVGSLIPDGPTTRGFDHFHGFHHSRHMETVIENDRVIEKDAVVNMLPRLTRKAAAYIDERAQVAPEQPFFLYLPLNSPHTPIVPSEDWQGKSGLGEFGDFVAQTDAALGAVLEALERNGMAENTLVIFSSDNGTSPRADFPALQEKGHWSSAHLRGAKADIWDGGHRIPFIVRWPGEIEAGSTSDHLLCLTDFFATVAELTGEAVPAGSCEDSVSFLPAFYGEPVMKERKGIIHHSYSGHFAYRTDTWKLILARGSGGWSDPRERDAFDAPEAQLYNMETDVSETTNLYEARPELAERLLEELELYVRCGRSNPGPASGNDFAPIEIWKSGRD